jgi:SAM-dependent methyltransferase
VVVQNRYTFDAHRVTGRQIKQAASIPAGFALFRRAQGGNEPIGDDAQGRAPQRRPLLRATVLERLMNARSRTLVTLLGAVAVGGAVLVRRHARGAMGKEVPVLGDAALYDALSHRFLLGPLFERIAADIAAIAPEGTWLLEVGCGPGRLSTLLASRFGLDVTGLDLDPAMIERARGNAEHSGHGGRRRPSFLVGDVSSLAFPDASFDVVVSTLSMHHWTDATAGLNEIGRVLRPNGPALVWDFRGGPVPLHGRLPNPVARARRSSLRVVSATPWGWPWGLTLTRRIEMIRAEDAPRPAES